MEYISIFLTYFLYFMLCVYTIFFFKEWFFKITNASRLNNTQITEHDSVRMPFVPIIIIYPSLHSSLPTSPIKSEKELN